jgi:uncharacterized protein YjbI with pentapeptide repeats
MTDSSPSSSSSDRDRSRIYPIHGDSLEPEKAAVRWSLARAIIADIRRRASNWWRSQPEQLNLSDEVLRRQHDAVSRAINNSLWVLVAFAFFCELAIGTPDTSLVTRDATIKLPIAGTEIYFATFLIVGPLILVAFSLYLQILVGYWLTLSRQLESTHPGLPFLFNLRGRVARGFSNFLFYWLVPAILASFAWKALPFPEAPWLILFLGIATVALLFAQIRKQPDSPSLAGPAVLWLGVFATACITVFAAVALLTGDVIISRSMNLRRADLSKQDLRGVNFKGAVLQDANLSGAHLEGANLTGAFLGSANLTRASLRKAHLRGAHLVGTYLAESNLEGADLQGADLTEDVLDKANLQGANLARASLIHTRLKETNLEGIILSQADLHRADLRSTDLRKANLAGANLRSAYLKGANLEEANLTAAVLELANLHNANLRAANLRLAQLKGAKLTNANLQGANLQGADLTDTAQTLVGEPNLSLEQINSAHGDEKTKLPPGIVRPDSWKQ